MDEAAEQREYPRFLTTFRVAKLMIAENTYPCVVRNISAGGMMIDAHGAFALGDTITVSLTEDQTVSGKICWQKETTLGIEFEAPVPVEHLLAKPERLQNGKRARPPRFEIERPVSVMAGAVRFPGRLCNISQRGAQVVADRIPAREQVLTLEIKGSKPLAGTVRWAHDGAFGVSFHDVVSVRDLMAWLSGES